MAPEAGKNTAVVRLLYAIIAAVGGFEAKLCFFRPSSGLSNKTSTLCKVGACAVQPRTGILPLYGSTEHPHTYHQTRFLLSIFTRRILDLVVFCRAYFPTVQENHREQDGEPTAAPWRLTILQLQSIPRAVDDETGRGASRHQSRFLAYSTGALREGLCRTSLSTIKKQNTH